MSSINNILSRLRESRIREDSQKYEYVFDIPWRESMMMNDTGEEIAHYRLSSMDHPFEIMERAAESFNEVSWAEYTAEDRRTEDCNILSMTMEFSNFGDCFIKVITSSIWDQKKIEAVQDYLTGQMSDGWGEGFEQQEIAESSYEEEEWFEDYEDEENGGYYETVEHSVSYYGQFWWHDPTHSWDITLFSTPHDQDRPTRESVNEDAKSMEFATDEEAHEWAEEHGYKVDKIQHGHGSKSCICWMTKKLDEDNSTSVDAVKWSYWEMPADYRGPAVQDHFVKDYGNDVLGFIYPPFESNKTWTKDESHVNYIAVLWYNKRAKALDTKEFQKMRDARAWLDDAVESMLSL